MKNKINNLIVLILTLSFLPFVATMEAKEKKENKIASVLKLNDENFYEVISREEMVVVDFYANWCPPCQRLAPIFAQVAKELEGSITFGKVNIDEAPKVVNEYMVKSIPMVVIFKEGKEVKRQVGFCDANSLKTFILESAQKN